MAYKLLAIDLDGTLLTSKKTLSPGNIEALNKAMDAGYRVILASGRPYAGIVNCVLPFETHDYIISSAGAQVHGPDGKLVHKISINPQRAYEVMNWCRDRGVHCQSYSDEGFHYIQDGPFARHYEKYNHMKGYEEPDLYKQDDIDTPKLLIIDTPEKVLEVKEEVRKAFPDLVIVNSQAEYVEVLDPAVSKAAALEWLAGELHATPDEIMAFGDNEVDLSMMEYAGFSVAVSNGESPVKAIADYITDSNDDDGVAKAIYQLLLKES